MTNHVAYKTIKPYCLWILYTLLLWCALSVLETYKEGSHIYRIAIGMYSGCTFTNYNIDVGTYILPLLFGLRIAPNGALKAWNHVASPFIIGIYIHSVIAMLIAPYFLMRWSDFDIILSFVSGMQYLLHSVFLLISIAGTFVLPKSPRLAVWAVRVACISLAIALPIQHIQEFGLPFVEIFLGSGLKIGCTVLMLTAWCGFAWWMYQKTKETLLSWGPLYPILICVPAMYAFALLIYLV